MPRGNRVLMLRSFLYDSKEDENGVKTKMGYKEGLVYNFPTHIARALIRKGYAILAKDAPEENN